MDSVLIGAVGTVAGAALGVSGTIWVQRRTRTDSRREELKQAINAFIRAAQMAQEEAGLQGSAERRGERSGELWATLKQLNTLADKRLRESASDYANEVNDCLWRPDDRPVYMRARVPYSRFEQDARRALGRGSSIFSRPSPDRTTHE